MSNVYLNDFERGGEAKMLEEFSITKDDIKDCTILCASYTQECYEGDCYVLFEKDGGLFEVHASHCSCYGLEDQWEPEPCDEVELRHRLEKGTWGERGKVKDHVIAALNSRPTTQAAE